MTDAAAQERDRPDIRQGINAAFGDRRQLAVTYAEILCTEGIMRGMIGPREADRVWERHILNSVAIAELISPSTRVVDLGSGAGLPGIPLAIARPDLQVVLLEPMLRRVRFLTECLTRLELANASVHHGRAEDGISPLADSVVVRAVAPLDRLVSLCQKILIDNGILLALKGSSASGEVDHVRRTMKIDAELLTVAAPGQSATVVRLAVPARPARRRSR